MSPNPNPSAASLPPVQQDALALVESLPNLSKPELLKLWPLYFRVPPFSPQRSIVEAALAHRIQEEAFGGLSRAVRIRLEAVYMALEQGKPPPALTRPRVRPGARLLRTWRGQLHEVTVLDKGKGFVYANETYSSLSEIARKITGVKWSGPLFFGLKKNEASKASA